MLGWACSEDHVPTGRMSRRKTQRGKTAKALRRPAATAAHGTAAAGLKKKAAVVTRARREARGRETAPSGVLRVISSSSGELAPVFESLLASARHLCGAELGIILLREGDGFRTVALHGATAEYTEARWRAPFIRPAADTGLGRVLETKQVGQIADVQAVAGYVGNPVQAPIVQLAGVRSKLTVPMLKDGDLIGVIEIDRREVRPFTDKQVELVKNFAAQAVIAIENARLLNELRESLEQQTATSEILGVISSSPGDLELVFATIVDKATHICDAASGCLGLFEEQALRFVAVSGAAAQSDFFHRDRLHQPGGCPYVVPLSRAKRTVETSDLTAEKGYLEGDPFYVTAADLGRARTVLRVPLLRENYLLGQLWIFREEVRPFTEKQVALVTNFAAQAVIAIENARLLSELRESLEQQTATSDVLRVISSSPTELQPVLDTLVKTASMLCRADDVAILRLEGDGLAVVAHHGPILAPRGYVVPLRGSVTGRCLTERGPVHVADLQAETEAYPEGSAVARELGHRTILAVPLLREGVPLGAINLRRDKVEPFTDKQIELVTTFADQAVIAIENVRLFDEVQARTRELQEALDYQTATSDVLEVISRTPIDLQPVLAAICATVAKLCNTKDAEIFIRDGDRLRLGWVRGSMGTEAENWPITRGLVMGRAVLSRELIHVHDLRTASEEYPEGYQSSLLVGHRTIKI